MLQAALPNGFRLRMLPRSVPAVFRQTGEIFYIGGADVLPAPLEGQAEADAIAGLSDPENETARSELIEHNLRLVVYIAQKFDNTGVGVEDLISIGTIGLIKAINTFNPEKKIKLATYASRCIENEILMYLRRNNKTRMEVSIDEPLNVDWDGNELLLSDILGTEEDVRTFEYNIVEFNKGGSVVDTYTETYVFNPERDIPILTSHCEEFIRFLEENRELITDKKIFGGEN